MSDTLDKDLNVKDTGNKKSKVVKTALQMIDDFETQRQEKDARIKNAKDYYIRAVDGSYTSRKYKMPSFVLNQVVEIYNTFIKVPDVQLKGYGMDSTTLLLMSRYLENVVSDGGFNSLMTQKWSGYRQQALYGDFFVQMGYDINKGREGMPVYRGVSSGSVATTATAEFISPYEEGNKATRFGIIISYSRGEMETLFPGAVEKVKPGELPNLSEWTNSTISKDDNQKSENKDVYQVLYFYDTVREVQSIIMGANAYEWKTFKGDDYTFKMDVRGVNKAYIPVAHFSLFAHPEGFFNKGIGEVFFNIVSSMTELDSGVLNTAIDNRNAPSILNIESADAGDLMQQIRLAKRRTEDTGDTTYVVPQASVDASGSINNPVGRSSIDYLKNENNMQEAEAIRARFDEEIRRFGFNLNSFFNQQDTAKQSELDIEGQNQTIGKFQDQNTDGYRLVYDFAIDSIVKFGNENDETLFGNDFEDPEIKGEKIGEIMEEAGNSPVTVGDVVKMFKDNKDILKLEIDTKSGFVHNPLLERRSLLQLLEVSEPGTPTHGKLISNLAALEGQVIDTQVQTPQAPLQA